jgi:hypothetical protein
VPDELFDEWLAVLSGAELKCLLYIVRRTLGFKKDADAISLSQMVNGITTRDGRVLDGGTGLNRSTVVAALGSLEARGLIIVVRAADDQGAALTSTYALRWRDEAAATPPPAPPSSANSPTRRGRERAVALVPKTPPATTVEVASQTAREVVGKLDQDYLPEVVGKSDQGGWIIRRRWLGNPTHNKQTKKQSPTTIRIGPHPNSRKTRRVRRRILRISRASSSTIPANWATRCMARPM